MSILYPGAYHRMVDRRFRYREARDVYPPLKP